MSWIASVLGSGVSDVLTSVDGLIGRFKASPNEKQAFRVELEQILTQRAAAQEARLTQTLESRERVLVAELQQSDNFTKRARPSVVYMGLVFIFLNYCIVPIVRSLGENPPSSSTDLAFPLPGEFWAAWGGIVATWAIGRSAEKMGRQGRVVSAITGNAPPRASLLDDAKG